MSWSRNVVSSNVQSLTYDDDTQELSVLWNSGRTSVYSGVPDGLADEVSRAPSVGVVMNEKIKPFYPHRYA
jgi:hypothetical protein